MVSFQPTIRKRMYFVGLLAIWFMVFSATTLHADIYKYVDQGGVMHFTNAPTSEKYEIFIKGNTEAPPEPSSDGFDHEPDPAAASTASSASFTTPVPSLSSLGGDSGIKNFSGTDAYDNYISIASQSYSIPFCLVKSIIKAESNFNCRAISAKGAQGLMQLMPDTARLMNVSDPFNPYENIMGGTRYFRMLLNQFNGKVKHALAGYNAGPGNVEIHKGIPPFQETRDYICRVARFYRQLKWKEILREKRNKELFQKEKDEEKKTDPMVKDHSAKIHGGLTRLSGHR